MLTAQELMTRLIINGVATPDEIRGCSAKEIAELERQEGVHLPKAYREFLRAVGHGAGRLMQDVSVFFKDVMGMAGRVKEDFEGIIKLPTNAFVFANRMGEVILYFIADGSSEDP